MYNSKCNQTQDAIYFSKPRYLGICVPLTTTPKIFVTISFIFLCQIRCDLEKLLRDSFGRFFTRRPLLQKFSFSCTTGQTVLPFSVTNQGASCTKYLKNDSGIYMLIFLFFCELTLFYVGHVQYKLIYKKIGLFQKKYKFDHPVHKEVIGKIAVKTECASKNFYLKNIEYHFSLLRRP